MGKMVVYRNWGIGTLEDFEIGWFRGLGDFMTRWLWNSWIENLMNLGIVGLYEGLEEFGIRGYGDLGFGVKGDWGIGNWWSMGSGNLVIG